MREYSCAMSDATPEDARSQWSGVAGAWASDAPRVAAAGGARAEAWLLERAALRPGQTVLEVACGTGATGIAAAERVLPGGTVLLSDFVDAMVEAARQRAERAGVANVDFAVLDAQDLGLEEASFDVVICGFGLMLVPDPERAVREACRVLRPGGRFVMTVWGEERANPWLGVGARSLMAELGAPEPGEGTPGPFALGSATRIETLLSSAGFARAEVERVELVEPHESLASWWSTVETSAGPMAAMLQALPAETRVAIRERAFEGARRFETESGALEFPSCFNGALATR
jgi:SAM-dependent methyltransferase